MVKFVRILCGLALISVLGGCAGNPPQASDPSPTTPTAESSPAYKYAQRRQVTYGELSEKLKSWGLEESTGGMFSLPHPPASSAFGAMCSVQLVRSEPSDVPAYDPEHVVIKAVFGFHVAGMAVRADGSMELLPGMSQIVPADAIDRCWRVVEEYNQFVYGGDITQLKDLVRRRLRMIVNGEVIAESTPERLVQIEDTTSWGTVKVATIYSNTRVQFSLR